MTTLTKTSKMKTVYHLRRQSNEMKSVCLVYLQDQKHKRTITQSKNSAVEENAAATEQCTLTQPKNGKRLNKVLGHCQTYNQPSPPKIFAQPRKKLVTGIIIYVYTSIAY